MSRRWIAELVLVFVLGLLLGLQAARWVPSIDPPAPPVSSARTYLM